MAKKALQPQHQQPKKSSVSWSVFAIAAVILLLPWGIYTNFYPPNRFTSGLAALVRGWSLGSMCGLLLNVYLSFFESESESESDHTDCLLALLCLLGCCGAGSYTF
jgi:bacteriorhodopsin